MGLVRVRSSYLSSKAKGYVLTGLGQLGIIRLLMRRQVVAIIDVDCAELSGFTTEDQTALEELAKLVADSCDF